MPTKPFFAFLFVLWVVVFQAAPQAAETTLDNFVRSLFEYDHAVPVTVTKGKVETKEGVRFTHVTFISVLDKPVTTWLVEKPGQTPTRLAIIQHGNSDSKEQTRHQHLAARLVKEMGYAVILTDAMYHGERTSPQVGKWSGKHLMERPNALRDIFLQTVRDHRRVIDGAREHLGLNLPVTYIGESLGTLMGTALLSVEKRIDRGVLLVGGADLTKIMPLSRGLKGFEELRHVIDPFFHVPAIKMPVLMLNGKLDVLFRPDDAERMYAGLGSAQKKLVWFETGHTIPPDDVFGAIQQWSKELDAAAPKQP